MDPELWCSNKYIRFFSENVTITKFNNVGLNGTYSIQAGNWSYAMVVCRSHSSAQVKWDGSTSITFNMSIGVKQGSVISPLL